MNVVILSPSFPYNFQNFYYQLREAGVNVLGIDQKPYDELNDRLQWSLEDYYYVHDLHNYNELEQALHYFTNKHGPIDYIESHNEYWLQTQANLATQFDIPALNNDEIMKFKRKSEMKKVFQSAGLNPAQGGLVLNVDEALSLAHKLRYPVIVKPDMGVGANGCRKLRNDDDVREFFRNKPWEDYIMEEFIDGDICTFDGLLDRAGNILFASSLAYDDGIAEVVQKQLDTYYYSLKEVPTDLAKLGRATLRAFNTHGCFFHYEYFRVRKDGRLMPIEVNRRPPGGMTIDMYNYSSDINLYKLWAEMIARKVGNFDYLPKYHCMAINRHFKNTYVHSHDEIIDRWNDKLVHHYSVPEAFASAMGNYCYFARSPDLQELLELQSFVQRQFTLEPLLVKDEV